MIQGAQLYGTLQIFLIVDGSNHSNLHKILHCFKNTGLPKSYNGLIVFIYSVPTHVVQIMHLFTIVVASKLAFSLER